MDEKLKTKLRSREYRAEFAEALLDDTIALQIRTIRESRNLSQAELARRAGMKQGAISRIESSDYGKWSVSTLKRIARALDVPLLVRFESWGRLIEAATHFTRADLYVPTFEEDSVFAAADRTVAKLSVTAALTGVNYAPEIGDTTPKGHLAPIRGGRKEPGTPFLQACTADSRFETSVAALTTLEA
jgi:transcriptional regulator with XRE-family HTH domain